MTGHLGVLLVAAHLAVKEDVLHLAVITIHLLPDAYRAGSHIYKCVARCSNIMQGAAVMLSHAIIPAHTVWLALLH